MNDLNKQMITLNGVMKKLRLYGVGDNRTYFAFSKSYSNRLYSLFVTSYGDCVKFELQKASFKGTEMTGNKTILTKRFHDLKSVDFIGITKLAREFEELVK